MGGPPPPPVVTNGIDDFGEWEIAAAEGGADVAKDHDLEKWLDESVEIWVFYRDGKTILTQISPADLRQVADDMMVYRDYGLDVTNAIVLLGNPDLSLDPNRLTTLDTYNAAGYAKPPLPVKLEYSSLPILSYSTSPKPLA